MKSRVYFTATNQSDNLQTIKSKLAHLLKESSLLDCVRREDKVAIKIHFGEEGNTGFVRPEYLRVIQDDIARRGANSCVADTNTLYRGRRMNSREHLKLAYEHGFTFDVVGVPVVIPDDTKKENVVRVPVKQGLIKLASIARIFREADVIVGVTHFKGHMMTGFGGTLKNLGMGCATREGKLAQHCGVAPFVIAERCVGCEACQKVCPVKAISLRHGKAHLDNSRCIGCASCIAACSSEAIDIDWSAGGETIQEKMVEYAQAVLKGKEQKSVFLNFLLKITKECDCLAKDDPRIAPDIGILASCDAVSIDRASMDLVNQACGRDIFKKVHPQTNPNQQLEYASKRGLGNLDYDFIPL